MVRGRMILAASRAPWSPYSSASCASTTVAPLGIRSAHSFLKVRAPLGSTRIAATSPTSSHSLAASLSPSAAIQQRESRFPITSGRSQLEGSSAVESCDVPSSARYLIATIWPAPLSPANARWTWPPLRDRHARTERGERLHGDVLLFAEQSNALFDETVDRTDRLELRPRRRVVNHPFRCTFRTLEPVVNGLGHVLEVRVIAEHALDVIVRLEASPARRIPTEVGGRLGRRLI